MHPGSGGPFDVCKRYEGNDSLAKNCESLVQSCVDQQQEQESGTSDAGATSHYELKECNGQALARPVETEQFETCTRFAARIAGNSDMCSTSDVTEAKPVAKPAEGDKVVLETVNGKARPSEIAPGSIIAIGSSDEGEEQGARYLIDRDGSDIVSTIEQWLGVTRPEAIKLRRGEATTFFRRNAQGAFERMVVSSAKVTPTLVNGEAVSSELADGNVIVVGALENAATTKLLRGISSGKLYFIDAGGQDVVSTIEAWLGVSRQDAIKMRRSVAVYVRENGTFRATTIAELSRIAAAKVEPEEKPQPKSKQEPELISKTKPEQESVSEPAPESELKPKAESGSAAGTKPVVEGEVAPAKGPMGFLESSPDTIDAIVKEIASAPYPIMVVVGQVARDVGDAECPHCVAFKEALVTAQTSGTMAYHRLIFINLNRPSARIHLDKLGLLDFVKRYGYVPQAYVFEGGRRTSSGDGVGEFTKRIQDEIKGADEPASEGTNEGPGDLGRLEQEAAIDARRKVLETAPTVELTRDVVVLTIDNAASNWNSLMKVVVTRALNDDVVRKDINKTVAEAEAFKVAVIDWNDPKGRALAMKLGISRLEHVAKDRLWEVLGEYREGEFTGTAKDRGGNNFMTKDLLQNYSFVPDADGFFYADDLVFDELFREEGAETIVVVGDPSMEKASEIAASLANGKKALGEAWRLVWIPHNDDVNASRMLGKLGLLKTVLAEVPGGQSAREIPDLPEPGEVRIWRVIRSGEYFNTAPYGVAGFAEMISRDEEQSLVSKRSEPVLLVVGASEGETRKKSEGLLAAIVAEQDAQVQKGGLLKVNGADVADVVTVDLERFKKLYASQSLLRRLVEKKGTFPQAFLFTGKPDNKGDRVFSAVELEDLPGKVVPEKVAPSVQLEQRKREEK